MTEDEQWTIEFRTCPTGYLSGPMRAFASEQYNAREFYKWASELRSRGIIVISPVERDIESGFDLDRTPEEISPVEIVSLYKRDLDDVLEADFVFAFQMEVQSYGRSIEIACARSIGKPVFHTMAEVDEWLLAWRAARDAMAA